mgnify:CR=1 FL=1
MIKSDLHSAVNKLYEETGSGYCFPPDKLWEFIDLDALGQTPHAVTNYLKKESFIVSTGASIKSVSPLRKGAPVTEYTFGSEIDPNSLAVALASKVGNSRSSVGATPSPTQTIQENFSGGCPGSGKSFQVSKDAEKAHFSIRTVFFQETNYYDFVGGLKPQSIYRLCDDPPAFIGSTIDVPGEPIIQYVVQPGPFLKAYRIACDNPGKSVVLIIEELSRAAAAHVFGDILQLLDRFDDGPLAGVSEYQVDARPDIESWLLLNDVIHDHVEAGKLRLPTNLYIWATMNRADQNARQLDSAFLRRWSKTYKSYLEGGKIDNLLVRYGGIEVEWGRLRQAVNSQLLKIGGIPEDKFVGAYMISAKKLADPGEVFEELWGYLWNDVLKTRSSQVFQGIETLAELRKSWNDGNGAIIGDLSV